MPTGSMDYAQLKTNVERAYGMPWRVGDLIAGNLILMDRSRNRIDPDTDDTLDPSDVQLEGSAYRKRVATWRSAQNEVVIEPSDTEGEWHFTFEPSEHGLYKLQFKLTGTYQATDYITVNVHDPLEHLAA